MAVDEERLEAAARNSVRERRVKGQARVLRARGSAELGEVAYGSVTQGLWLRNGKVGSQVIGEDRSRFPGKETVGKLGEEEDEEGEPETKQRREYTDLGLDLGEREEQVICHASASALALAMTDEARRQAEM